MALHELVCRHTLPPSRQTDFLVQVSRETPAQDQEEEDASSGHQAPHVEAPSLPASDLQAQKATRHFTRPALFVHGSWTAWKPGQGRLNSALASGAESCGTDSETPETAQRTLTDVLRPDQGSGQPVARKHGVQ